MTDTARTESTGAQRAHASNGAHGGQELRTLALGAIGVVYGDIGTSPLYAMRECLNTTGEHSVRGSDPANVFGVVSLFFWSLALIVCLKYLVLVLRADNKGEGGILALAALVRQTERPGLTRLATPILLAMFGAGLLYGEGLITPAISVLSAVEGLSHQSARLTDVVIPVSIVILIGLFWVQRYGTGRIGSVFGWVMLVWFAAIAASGVPHIARHPEILGALSPHHAIEFLTHNGVRAFLLLGSIVLCVTGCEALYADMGHFGRRPVRLAWFTVVFPAPVVNYFGQGALYLERGDAITNPFYEMFPAPLVIPMVVLATMAAIIASQALISGAFSLTNQAVQLGYLPRVMVVHTSHKQEGQIYVPEVNYLFMVACVGLVLAFQSSSNLAAAYGIAVTGTMSITSFLIFLVCLRKWKFSLGAALAIYVPLVAIDSAFLSANLVKLGAGGWFPLVVGIGMFTIMTTWWRGRLELSKTMATGAIPDELFLADIAETKLPRVSGTAVFMASSTDGMPNVLLHHVKHNKVLHRQVVLLSV
ncbi:MAG TPA: KUP/HAK/KT family potassium transporter, partial [Kofleriaceae bacterium]|nr:KUP/HAK/KT family potassium transporter [Kofleriaceae bacterium]